jgi:hypothetical protein
MDETTVAAISRLLELGFPAVVLIICVIIWRSYQTILNRYLDHLESDEKERELDTARTPQSIEDKR